MLIGLTLLLGVAFIILQWLGFQQLWEQKITFRGSGAGQFLYVIFGLHAIHVIGGVLALIVMYIKAFIGRTKLYSSVPVEGRRRAAATGGFSAGGRGPAGQQHRFAASSS